MKRDKERSVKISMQPDQSQSKTDEILAILNDLFQMRLVQKISRPMPFASKQSIFREFKRKFIILHQFLQICKKQTIKETESTYSKNKSLNTNKGVKQKVQKNDIKKVQMRYSEVLIDGSFKFYYIVAKLYGLPVNLDVINIEQWADQCLEDQQQKSCCC